MCEDDKIGYNQIQWIIQKELIIGLREYTILLGKYRLEQPLKMVKNLLQGHMGLFLRDV